MRSLKTIPDPLSIDSLMRRVQALELDLYLARAFIIDLMPESKKSILLGFNNCNSEDDRKMWERGAIEEIIDLVQPQKHKNDEYSERAFCPLCGDGSTERYVVGYSYPEGLRRHLRGWGNNPKCYVLATTMKLAHRRWDYKFSRSVLAGVTT